MCVTALIIVALLGFICGAGCTTLYVRYLWHRQHTEHLIARQKQAQTQVIERLRNMREALKRRDKPSE